jgi:hypothetical protein
VSAGASARARARLCVAAISSCRIRPGPTMTVDCIFCASTPTDPCYAPFATFAQPRPRECPRFRIIDRMTAMNDCWIH